MSDKNLPTDIDPYETQEWLDSLSSVIDREGHERAHFLIEQLIDSARRSGVHIPHRPTTAYVNTISAAQEERSSGDHAIEWRVRSLIRWNALAIVVRANQTSTELGGHIASFASSATLYDVGFNHFWHAPSENPWRRSNLHSGTFRSRYLCQSLFGRTAERRGSDQFQARSHRRWLTLLPSSATEARLLAVPDGLHGARSDHGNLSGSVYEVST